MRQLTYTGPNELEWREAPSPASSSDAAALVRPRAVATCDLDALIIEGELPVSGAVPPGATSASRRCSSSAIPSARWRPDSW